MSPPVNCETRKRCQRTSMSRRVDFITSADRRRSANQPLLAPGDPLLPIAGPSLLQRLRCERDSLVVVPLLFQYHGQLPKAHRPRYQLPFTIEHFSGARRKSNLLSTRVNRDLQRIRKSLAVAVIQLDHAVVDKMEVHNVFRVEVEFGQAILLGFVKHSQSFLSQSSINRTGDLVQQHRARLARLDNGACRQWAW